MGFTDTIRRYLRDTTRGIEHYVRDTTHDAVKPVLNATADLKNVYNDGIVAIKREMQAGFDAAGREFEKTKEFADSIKTEVDSLYASTVATLDNVPTIIRKAIQDAMATAAQLNPLDNIGAWINNVAVVIGLIISVYVAYRIMT